MDISPLLAPCAIHRALSVQGLPPPVLLANEGHIYQELVALLVQHNARSVLLPHPAQTATSTSTYPLLPASQNRPQQQTPGSS